MRILNNPRKKMTEEVFDPLLIDFRNQGYLRHLLVFCENEGSGRMNSTLLKIKLMISFGESNFEQLARDDVFVGNRLSQGIKIMPGIAKFKHSLLFGAHFDLAVVESAGSKAVEKLFEGRVHEHKSTIFVKLHTAAFVYFFRVAVLLGRG